MTGTYDCASSLNRTCGLAFMTFKHAQANRAHTQSKSICYRQWRMGDIHELRPQCGVYLAGNGMNLGKECWLLLVVLMATVMSAKFEQI